MPTVTDSDIASAVRTRWAAVTALNALIASGSVFRGRVPERTAFPYARFTVRETSREHFSGSAYLAVFAIEIDAYTAAQPPVSGAIQEALNAAFNGPATNPSASITVPNATQTVFSMADPGAFSEPTGERVDGRDVIRTRAAFRLMVEGAR